MLARNSNEGGVESRFLVLLNQGQLSEEEEFVPCTNYEKGSENIIAQGVNNPREQIPLEKWLCTAPFLFTLLDSTDESDIGMHAMQINQDVLDTISYAIDQLQVSEIPDLCVLMHCCGMFL